MFQIHSRINHGDVDPTPRWPCCQALRPARARGPIIREVCEALADFTFDLRIEVVLGVIDLIQMRFNVLGKEVFFRLGKMGFDATV